MKTVCATQAKKHPLVAARQGPVGLNKLELIMQQETDFSNIGNRIPVSIMGLSIAGDMSQLSHDSIDCIPAIEPCGQEVHELWFHTAEGVSVRIITNKDDLLSFGKSLVALFESEAA